MNAVRLFMERNQFLGTLENAAFENLAFRFVTLQYWKPYVRKCAAFRKSISEYFGNYSNNELLFNTAIHVKTDP